MDALKALALKLISKQTLIRWGSAVLLTVGAAAAGMQNAEFKAAVCSASPIEAK